MAPGKRVEAKAEMMIRMDDIKLPQDLQRLRVDAEKMEELVRSIKRVGLISPIILQKSGKKFVLVAGYRRYLAHKELKLEQILARVLLREKDFADEITLDENFVREDINAIEEAIWLRNVQKKESMSLEQIARKIGKSKSFVKARLDLLALDDELIEVVAAGELGVSVAKEIAKASDAGERALILRQVLENGASLKTVQYWVQDANLRASMPDTPELIYKDPDAEFKKYAPPEFVCDICGNKTTLVDSKFVRACERCFQVARENLRAPKEKDESESP